MIHKHEMNWIYCTPQNTYLALKFTTAAVFCVLVFLYRNVYLSGHKQNAERVRGTLFLLKSTLKTKVFWFSVLYLFVISNKIYFLCDFNAFLRMVCESLRLLDKLAPTKSTKIKAFMVGRRNLTELPTDC